MARPSLDFLCVCIADALLAHYRIERPPVPVASFLRAPPEDLLRDLGLVERLPFGKALWLRDFDGQGRVYVNSELSEVEQRFAIAGALFIGLCSTKGGEAVGLPAVPNPELPEQAALFARTLLVPAFLLPPGWEQMTPEAIAQLFQVPIEVARTRLRELKSGGVITD